jgi:hypothetical protein
MMHELLFIQLVAMLQAAAMQNMGKILNPINNEMERDLKQARVSIDMLEMIKQKTTGNLKQSEDDFLDKILFELHMNYVDEVNKAAEDSGKGVEDAEKAAEHHVKPEKRQEPSGSEEKVSEKASKPKAKRRAKPKGKGK